MSGEKHLNRFTIPELKVFRLEVLSAETKEELLETIDKTIQEKEYASSKSLNARFPVDWFNIDPQYISLLHDNGIYNLHQLREIKNIRRLSGMTQGGYEQISWARDFFDMTSLEELPPEERTTENVVKVIVKHANECEKKHKAD